jgi:hypothetical protein
VTWWSRFEGELRCGRQCLLAEHTARSPKAYHGDEEATEVQEGTHVANGPRGRALCNRAFDGRSHHSQHDARRDDVGVSAALSIGGKALLVSVGAAKMLQSSLILSVQVKTRILLTTVSRASLMVPALRDLK